MTLQNYFSHPRFSYLFCPTSHIKLELRLQIAQKLLILIHMDPSNYLANQKQGAINKYDLTVFIRLFHGHSSLPVNSLDLTSYTSSSKVSRAGLHTQLWWRCSYMIFYGCFLARIEQPDTLDFYFVSCLSVVPGGDLCIHVYEWSNNQSWKVFLACRRKLLNKTVAKEK